METTRNFIPKADIEMIDIHATLAYYLIILKHSKGTWYAKEFTADCMGLKGEFHTDRF